MTGNNQQTSLQLNEEVIWEAQKWTITILPYLILKEIVWGKRVCVHLTLPRKSTPTLHVTLLGTAISITSLRLQFHNLSEKDIVSHLKCTYLFAYVSLGIWSTQWCMFLRLESTFDGKASTISFEKWDEWGRQKHISHAGVIVWVHAIRFYIIIATWALELYVSYSRVCIITDYMDLEWVFLLTDYIYVW